jgi:hypothetical protein
MQAMIFKRLLHSCFQNFLYFTTITVFGSTNGWQNQCYPDRKIIPMLSLQVRQNHQHICQKDRQNPKQAKRFLPKQPALLILHPLEKKFPEGIERRLAGEAIINVLVILICFEPKFIAIGKEEQAEE